MLEHILYEEFLRRERSKEENRPCIRIPLPSPEYLRYKEEEELRKKKKDGDESRGVITIQM